jgi:uncharacterized RDD family membrane protein YckC
VSSHDPLPSFPGQRNDPLDELDADAGYAGWWTRVGAYVLDGLILACVFVGLAAIIGFHNLFDFSNHVVNGRRVYTNHAPRSHLIVWNLVDNVFLLVYATWLLSSRWRATVGMRVASIHIESLDGKPVTLSRAAGRSAIVVIASALTLFAPVLLVAIIVDLLWPLWDSRNQTLHDRLAGTVVRKGRVH